MRSGLRWNLVALSLLALVGAAPSALGQDDYVFIDPAWDLDFLHAGDPEEDANYPEIMGSGACVLDYDGDDWLDLFVVNGRYADATLQQQMAPVSALYHNDGGAGFSKVDGELAIDAWGMGCATGDYDNDGDPDVALSTWGMGTFLYRNDGGTFTNVTHQAGVRDSACGQHWCFGASIAFFDYDLDADLDLFVTNYVDWDGEGPAAPNAQPAQCNTLWRNDGNGGFTDVTQATGVADCLGNHLGLAIADFDGNGYQDVYVASDETANALLMNDGAGMFTDRADDAHVADTRGGMGTAVGDFDGDGLHDIFITHFESEGFALYQQQPGFTFTDVMTSAGLARTEDYVGWGTEFVDLDMDGHLDLVMVNGHVNVTYTGDNFFSGGFDYAQDDLVYRNLGDGTFEDVTGSYWSPGPKLGVGRGLAFADFDGDGYLDPVVVNNANETAEVWRSARGPNNWLTLRLTGTGLVNPDALGATVAVTVDGRTVEREVAAQNSYLSQSTRDLHLGLGSALAAEEVVITWPTGASETFTDVSANRIISASPASGLGVIAARPLASAPAALSRPSETEILLTGTVERGGTGTVTTEWTIDGESFPGSSVAWTPERPGVYDARFRVTDELGYWDEATTEISVTNKLPTAVIAAPETADRVQPTQLDGSASTDPDGDITAWSWDVDGVTYEGDLITHTFTSLGAVAVTLTVTDDAGGTATDSVTVDVQNLLPVVVAGGDRLARPAAPTYWTLGTSHDPEDALASWVWDFGDGSTATCDPTGCALAGAGVALVDAFVEKRYADAGAYSVVLTLTDADGGVASDATAVVVAATGPVARITAPAMSMRVLPATFSAADSTGDVPLTQHAWTFDGVSASGVEVDHVFHALGWAHVTLLVVDEGGARGGAEVLVDVVNAAPVITLAPGGTRNTLDPVTFTTAATDPDGSVATVAWDFGDGTDVACGLSGCTAGHPHTFIEGSFAAGWNVTHTFPAFGAYDVTVTATDNDGATVSAGAAWRVEGIPVAKAGPDHIGDRVTSFAFDASASVDLDGTIVSWTWAFGDGGTAACDAAGCVLTLVDGATVTTQPVVAYTYATLGVFTATLTVTDNDGWMASDTALVTVVNRPPVAALTGHPVINLHQRVLFDASASQDPDDGIASWAWRVDGVPVSGQGATAALSIATPGDHVVSVTVTDADGASDSAQWGVNVVTALAVTVDMDKATFGLSETPRGTVTVRFVTGDPVPFADVDVVVTYVIERGRLPPMPVKEHEHAYVSGVTDENGAMRFSVRATLLVEHDGTVVKAHLPTATVHPGDPRPIGHERVDAAASWRGNAGAGVDRYTVRAASAPA